MITLTISPLAFSRDLATSISLSLFGDKFPSRDKIIYDGLLPFLNLSSTVMSLDKLLELYFTNPICSNAIAKGRIPDG